MTDWAKRSCEDCVRLSAQCFANWIERQQVLLHVPVCVLTAISQAVMVERLLVPRENVGRSVSRTIATCVLLFTASMATCLRRCPIEMTRHPRKPLLSHPDLHVAWRGDKPTEGRLALIEHLRGASAWAKPWPVAIRSCEAT
jgi:hypothetical protein